MKQVGLSMIRRDHCCRTSLALTLLHDLLCDCKFDTRTALSCNPFMLLHRFLSMPDVSHTPNPQMLRCIRFIEYLAGRLNVFRAAWPITNNFGPNSCTFLHYHNFIVRKECITFGDEKCVSLKFGGDVWGFTLKTPLNLVVMGNYQPK